MVYPTCVFSARKDNTQPGSKLNAEDHLIRSLAAQGNEPIDKGARVLNLAGHVAVRFLVA